MKAARWLPLLLALPLAATAQDASAPHWRAAVEAEHSDLDNGYADWNAATLRLSRHWSRRQLAELQLTRTRRFGLEDHELAAGGAVPLSDALTASVQATWSPTYRVLPRASLAGWLQYEFRPAWLLHGGLRHTDYRASDVNRASVMLEHYFGDWSVLAGLHAVHAFGQDTRTGELRATWYYGERSSVGAIASAGREVVETGPGATALASVRSVALVGAHALDARWTLRWGAHHVRQGDFYTRTGVSLGVQAHF